MTDNEKIPYIQCLYHTGKKVYKYWLVALAVIGIIFGLYFVIASQLEKINNIFNTITNTLGYVGYVLTNYLNSVWSLTCSVPWYWWVLFGVTIGPLILVAIWCALKHYDVEYKIKNEDCFVIFLIDVFSILATCNFMIKYIIDPQPNYFSVSLFCISIMWIIIRMSVFISIWEYYYDNN